MSVCSAPVCVSSMGRGKHALLRLELPCQIWSCVCVCVCLLQESSPESAVGDTEHCSTVICCRCSPRNISEFLVDFNALPKLKVSCFCFQFLFNQPSFQNYSQLAGSLGTVGEVNRAMRSAVLAVGRCLSVRLSVSLVHCIQIRDAPIIGR